MLREGHRPLAESEVRQTVLQDRHTRTGDVRTGTSLKRKMVVANDNPCSQAVAEQRFPPHDDQLLVVPAWRVLPRQGTPNEAIIALWPRSANKEFVNFDALERQ